MIFSLVVISPLFEIHNDNARIGPVAVMFVVIFTFFYSIGAGPVPFTLSAEVFPLSFRGALS